MPDTFSKIDPKQDFVQLEHDMLALWRDNDTFAKRAAKNRGAAKKWSFIDGPITANNPMGVHHGWGRTYKDVFQRYWAMRGADERFQNGFDCQGLWVEVEVEKSLGLNSKQDIIAYGLDKFARACRDRVLKYAGIQAEQSRRLGQWMDWENSYYTMSEQNNEHIWHFLKKVRERGWLFKGHAVMPWCTRCGTALSQHELSDGGYADLEHKTVFVKFPIKNRAGEFFLVWTTTPWTLSSNVALAVHPDLQYVKIRTADGELLILSKKVAEKRFADAEVVAEMRGADLINTHEAQYDSLYPELRVQQDTQRVVIPWDQVGEEEGTGIVHIAPGCGEEDAKLGKEFKLKALNPLDEFGMFIDEFGSVTKLSVLKSADEILDGLKQRGAVERIESITHRYPICWRCKTPCVFRMVDEWFMSAQEIRPLMKRAAAEVTWMPESSGKRMQDWLDNMGDWVISRKRFWGLALPFYECRKCDELVVVGSLAELRERAVNPERLDELQRDPDLKYLWMHRPWIDEIRVRCEKCDREIERVPDVGDCWLDAGIVPFSTLNYLHDRAAWEQWFPAEFVVESRSQIRLWFYSMLFMGVTLEDRAPYKQVKTYETVVDEKGHEMHKSAGNSIPFDEAAEKMGADVMRWMYLSQSATNNLRFGYGRGEEIRKKLISLWNVYSFFTTYAAIDGVTREELEARDGAKSGDLLDQWIVSLLQELIADCRASLESSHPVHAMKRVDHFVSVLSGWYVRRSRRRFWKNENDADKLAAYRTLYRVLKTLARVMAPMLPFVSEAMYQGLRTGGDSESVHLTDYPEVDQSAVRAHFTERMDYVLGVVELGHSARAAARVKNRQPLARVLLARSPIMAEAGAEVAGMLQGLITDELNVKSIEFVDDVSAFAKPRVSIDARVLGPKIGRDVQQLIALARAGDYELRDQGARVEIGGRTLDAAAGEFLLSYESLQSGLQVAAVPGLVVVLDVTLTPALIAEGVARELIRAIQDLRKESGFNIEDRISLAIETQDADVRTAVEQFGALIGAETLAEKFATTISELGVEAAQKEIEIDGKVARIGIRK